MMMGGSDHALQILENALLNILMLFKKSLESSNLLCGQLRRQHLTKKRILIFEGYTPNITLELELV